MEELKPCPFCGYNKLKIDRKRKREGYAGLDIVYYDTYSVRCPKCFGRGGAVGGRILAHNLRNDGELPEWATTAEELKARAAEAWNRRAEK